MKRLIFGGRPRRGLSGTPSWGMEEEEGGVVGIDTAGVLSVGGAGFVAGADDAMAELRAAAGTKTGGLSRVTGLDASDGVADFETGLAAEEGLPLPVTGAFFVGETAEDGLTEIGYLPVGGGGLAVSAAFLDQDGAGGSGRLAGGGTAFAGVPLPRGEEPDILPGAALLLATGGLEDWGDLAPILLRGRFLGIRALQINTPENRVKPRSDFLWVIVRRGKL